MLLDGELVCACLVLAAQADGHDVVTVEGLGAGDDLHPVQQAFVDAGAVQCGFCTPGPRRRDRGAARARRRTRARTRSARRSPGNLCRCTGYEKIFDAVRLAAASDERGRCASRRARELELGRVGESVKRVDGVPKTTGEFAYASDLSAAGMLWGHTLRSPHAHARIRSIDLSAALALPGVHAVLTHADVPGQKTYGLEFADQPVLAIDRVRYFGEPVARRRRRASRSRRGARPSGSSSSTSRSSRSSTRSARPSRSRCIPTGRRRGHGYRDDPRPNVVRTMLIRHGDPEAAGDVVVERRLRARHRRTRRSSAPSPGLAVPDGEGGVDIYVATQWLHVDREQVAPCLGLPEEQVRIHLAGVGGAFGGREDLSMQIHAALLALHTSRPVKMVYNREESFTGHVHRHPARIWAEHRATRDGRLVSVRMRILLDGGAYASSSTAVTANAASFACGPYSVPNALIESTCVYTNNPPCGAMRGFGAVQTCFAAEAQMDKLAAALEHRSGRAAAAERARARRHAADRAADHRLAARRGGDPALCRAARAGAGGAAARRDPAARRRRQHDARRGRAARRRLRGRLQEPLLLGGLRRLLRRARAALRGRLGRGALRRGRGRPGRVERHPPGRAHRARHGPRAARSRLDRRRSARPARRRRRA